MSIITYFADKFKHFAKPTNIESHDERIIPSPQNFCNEVKQVKKPFNQPLEMRAYNNPILSESNINAITTKTMKAETTTIKISKSQLVKKHLIEKGSITSWEAIELYGQTRLSDTIFRLRRKGFNIDSVDVDFTDRFGNKGTYSKYIYRSEQKD